MKNITNTIIPWIFAVVAIFGLFRGISQTWSKNKISQVIWSQIDHVAAKNTMAIIWNYNSLSHKSPSKKYYEPKGLTSQPQVLEGGAWSTPNF